MNTPESILNKKDKGDDTQRRFRYQNACACFISLNLLSKDCRFTEVFCEHHEDILLKLKGGKFSGIQIKTRNLELGPFDINDEAVYKSFKRFVEHDQNFPNQFATFIFATNVGLLKSESIGANEYIAWLIKSEPKEMQKSRKTFGVLSRKIAKDLNVEVDVVLTALKKVRFKEGLPHDGDIYDKIGAKIGSTDECRNTYWRIINEITNKLIQLHDDASSLKIDTDYTFLEKAPTDSLEIEIIEKKKITYKKIVDVLTDELFKQKENLIKVANNSIVQSIPKSVKVLEKKMDVGDITIDNINLTKDHKFAFEALITEKFYKNKAQTEIDYNHLRQIALSESQTAYDENYNEVDAFGMKMLQDIRKSVRARYLNDKESFSGCQIEHIFGLIAILTEECKVWWSQKFELENYGDLSSS